MHAMLSELDTSFIDNLSTRMVTDFRNDTFSKDFIDKNPQIFLNVDWINVPKLKLFIEGKTLFRKDVTVKIEHVASRLIKNEADLDERRHDSLYGGPQITSIVQTRVILGKTVHEVIEIFSDSEDDQPSHLKEEEEEVVVSTGSVAGTGGGKKKKEMEKPKIAGNVGMRPSSRAPFDPSMFTEKSGTIWTDSNITSFAVEGTFQVTKELRVDRVEYLTDIPSVWPIPKLRSAFILDLRDDGKYLVHKKTDSLATPVTPDFLIKNKDQDSWKGGTGTADSTAQVTFQQGFPSVTCRRSRLICKGAYACLGIDPALLDVERHDLDPGPRLKIFAAQKATRVDEQSSVEQRAATFLNVCRSRCPAIDNNGKACNGQPKMKEKSEAHSGRGHSYFIACNGWTRSFNDSHQTHTIPDSVNEDVLARLINGEPLEAGSDTNPCSLIISSHIGLRQAHCPHPHIQGGRSDDRLPIVNHPCSARRTIYIPIDSSLRFALIVHKDDPHNHPMPRIDKASFETKAAYRRCVEAAGVLGATVQKVDQASSTSVLLDGKTPGQYNGSLLNGRIKQKIVYSIKSRSTPAGKGITGAYNLFLEERDKPVEARYIQSFINTPDGGTLIFTCVPALLKLIHDVTSFECDVTFKRVKVLNEWELVIYYPPVERAITIARAYINKADTDYYTILFDELQELTLRLTGKPLRFKRLSRDGNLLCMNADMEAAQILGAARSFMKTNDTAYSQIDVESPEELLAYFVRVCLTHSKRGVLNFKFLVTAPEYQRILDFPYMKSQAELDDFTRFITMLGIKKIKDWWDHKIKSTWIIPCILASQSKIFVEHWSTTPATTNVGESQHHWTNKLTGIGLTLLEGIQTARVVDEQVADEVESSLKTGVMKNNQTGLFHRQNRANQRLISTARKSRREAVLQESLSGVQSRIASEKAAHQQSLLQQREYEASLKRLTDNGVSGNSRMSLALFEETSQLRKKIANEKDLRRRLKITQSSLMDELSEISASASGKPGTGAAKRVQKVNHGDIEASSSGRVSAAFVRGMADPPDRTTASPSNKTFPGMVQQSRAVEVEGYSDAEMFEEEDDFDAAFDEVDLTLPVLPYSHTSASPRPDHSTLAVSTNAVSQHQHAIPSMYEHQNANIIAQGTEDHSQQLSTFGNDSNIDGSSFIGYDYRAQDTSFMDLLMDDSEIGNSDLAFGFADSSGSIEANGCQWESYRSTAASSSGEDLSMYGYGGVSGGMYSSSEGGYSTNNIEMSLDADANGSNYSLDMLLPIPRMPTPSPPSLPAQSPSVDDEIYHKRPRSPVAADLDTANILPVEHRRKRMRPARVRV